jgi:DNA-binding CsgD family transcriptional regulator
MDAGLEAHLLARCDTVWRGQLDRADEVSRVAALVASPKLRIQAVLTRSVIAFERGDPVTARTLATKVIDAGDGAQARLAAVVVAATWLDDRPDLCVEQVFEAAGADLGAVPVNARPWISDVVVRRGLGLPLRRRQADELTVREQEIVGLVSRGLTNRQIGEHLHLSPRTVQSHLSQVFGKLNVTNRTALLAEYLHKGHRLTSRHRS